MSADASATKVEEVRDGATVGRYRLCFKLASGGMATVFLARAEGPAGFEKLVALKRMRPHLVNEQSFVDMFLDEARLASQISHANVCTVFDFGESDGEYYIAMEYLVGESLSKIRKSAKQLNPELMSAYHWVIASLMADACEGLHAAHELRDENNVLLDLVHRDVSPQNIFVTYDGVAKLVDFGVARARNRLHETTTGLVKGKHAYMAPEQLTGGTLDRRTDVWAMGVVLWELLTLRPLFRGRNESETLFRVVSSEIPHPSSINPSVPKSLDAVAMQALNRPVEQRFSSAREMGRALHRAIAKEPEPMGRAEVAEWMAAVFSEDRIRKQQLVDVARQMSGEIPSVEPHDEQSESTQPESRIRPTLISVRTRRRRTAGLSIVALVAAGVGGGWWLGQRDASNGSPREVEQLQQTANEELTPLSSEEPSSEEPSSEDQAETETQDDTHDTTQATDETTEATAVETAPLDADTAVRPVKARPGRRGVGTVAVGVRNGWGTVYEGGRELGRTPLQVQLPSGRHRLRVVIEGGATQRLRFNLRPGQTYRRVLEAQ